MAEIPKLDLDLTNENEDEHSAQPQAAESSARASSLLSLDQLQRRNLCAITEFKAICSRPLEGIYVRPSHHDILEWFGVIVVKAGVFAGGIFRFTLTLPPTFPETEQTIELEQNILHPLVYSKTNRVDFKRFFPSNWVPDRNKIYHVLSAFQSIFFRYQCDVEVAANPEAALLWKENRKQFKQFANMAVRESRTQIYDAPKSDDPQSFRQPWDASVMEPLREAILGKRPPSKETIGLLSKEPNPYGSFFRAEKASYLCDVFTPEEETTSGTFYEPGDESD
ncbi:AKT-interacting protein [Aphelenchoides fujianensis]|nr:AKT-interacting protein [Aphelenchoides fujianensis]